MVYIGQSIYIASTYTYICLLCLTKYVYIGNLCHLYIRTMDLPSVLYVSITYIRMTSCSSCMLHVHTVNSSIVTKCSVYDTVPYSAWCSGSVSSAWMNAGNSYKA